MNFSWSTTSKKLPISFALISLTTLTGCFDHVNSVAVVRLKAAVEFTTFQNRPKAQWAVDKKNQAYTNATQLNVSGICSGITSMRVNVNNTYTGVEIPCDATRQFSWSFPSNGDGAYVLRIDPKLSDGSILASQSLSQTFIVDTVPPAPPIITTNGGGNVRIYTPALRLDGTAASDVHGIEVNSAGNLSFNENLEEFTFTTDLNYGDTILFRFVAYDLAGNRSAPTTTQVIYGAQVHMVSNTVSGTSAGAVTLGTGGTTVLENVSTTPMLMASNPQLSGPSGYKLWTGFLDAIGTFVP